MNDFRTEMESVQAALADLLASEPLPVEDVPPPPPPGTPWVVALLGPKDHGKTTLINALVGERVSEEESGIGEGTRFVTAWVHEDGQPALAAHLSPLQPVYFESAPPPNTADDVAAGRLPIRVRTHRRDDLRGLALLDLPDFTSDADFPEHLEVVRRIRPRLDGAIWVLSALQYTQQRFYDFLSRTPLAPETTVVAVTKIDEQHRRMYAGGHREVRDTVDRLLGGPMGTSANGRVYLVDSLHPEDERYDFPRLSREILRARSPEEIEHGRESNLQRRRRYQIDRVRAHFAVVERAEDAGAVLTAVRNAVEARFGTTYREAVLARIEDGEIWNDGFRVDLYDAAVRDLPLFRVFGMPLRFLVGLRRLLGGGREDLLRRALSVEGLSLNDRLRGLVSTLRADLGDRIYRLRKSGARGGLFAEETAIQKDLLEGIDDGLRSAEEEVLVAQRSRYGRRSFFVRLFWYLILVVPFVWFPFVQPLLERILEGAPIAVAVLAVRMLGARYWLQSLGLLLLIYGGVGILYFLWSTRRGILERRRRCRDFLEKELTARVQDSLAAPLRRYADRLETIIARLDRLSTGG